MKTMSEKAWKQPQLDAIGISHPKILVSASAGTGKTTVLTERLIRKLTGDNPIDISSVIVVTFTKAAADELKNRISAALSEALAKDPGNRRLSRQLVSLSHAKISTIHSFCLDLIRKHFEDLGLDPNLRVIDEDEKALLDGEVITSVLEDYYENSPEIAEDEKIADFPALIDRFVSVRDEEITSELIGLYDRIRGLPDGFDIIRRTASDYDQAAQTDFFETPWGIPIRVKFRNVLISARAASARLLSESRNPDIPDDAAEKLTKVLQNDAEVIDALLSVCCHYGSLYEILRVRQPNGNKLFLDKPRNCDKNDTALSILEKRAEYTSEIKKLKDKYCLYPAEDVRKTAPFFASVTRDLSRLLTRFGRVMRTEKRKRGILDFGDIETYAYELLVRDGKPTPTAEEISANYREICIDEYQDVNEIQDRIFTAISGSTERFMVGDIKQSIYSFRGASPSLFLGYRKEPEVKKIYLQHNFRCSKPIIDFVNRVSGRMFSAAGSGFPYEPGDDLVPGKEETGEGIRPEIVLMTGKENRQESTTPEAEYIAETIAEMIKSEGRKPSDFVILLRSCNHAFFYETALNKRGIPVYSQLSHEFFENPEILLMLCILNVIDNPTNDIYFSGLLRSPLFGFTLDELLNIRAEAKEGSLYSALSSYTSAHSGFTKGTRFLEKLNEYRKDASSLPADRLIWKLYTDNDILSLVYADETASGDDITVRRANLMLLYENARKFESDSFHGLYPFIRYLSQMIESKAGEKLESAQPFGEGMNTVKIMSIHKSKGLEFPVVFLARANSGFSNAESKKLLPFCRETGLCFKPVEASDSVRIDTPFLEGELAAIDANRNAEEMRILYVALTRAKERLFVSAIFRDQEELNKMLALRSESTTYTKEETDAAFAASPSYVKWILLALGNSSEYADVTVLPDQTEFTLTLFSDRIKKADKEAGTGSGNEEALKEHFRKVFSFRYPYEEATRIPAKLSVSELYPGVLDEEDTEAERPAEKPIPKKPLFLQNEAEQSEASAAERGTATHVFMQFCSFENAEKNGIDAELNRLTENRFLPESMAALVNKEAVLSFLSSPLYSEMKKAQSLKRETRFNVRLPAVDFASDPEQKRRLASEFVLVQGVIDCYFVTEEGKVVLVDYKTDKVPSDRKTAEALLRQRHSLQLTYYKKALEKILLKPIDKTLLYSFSLADTVEIL